MKKEVVRKLDFHFIHLLLSVVVVFHLLQLILCLHATARTAGGFHAFYFVKRPGATLSHYLKAS